MEYSKEDLQQLSKPRNNADFRYSSMIIHNRS